MAAFSTSPPRRVQHSCLWRITEERSEFEVKYTVYQPIQEIQRGVKYETYFLWDSLQNSYFRFSIFYFIMKISNITVTSVHHLRSISRIFVHRSVKCAVSQSI